jgi:hypothetical protein
MRTRQNCLGSRLPGCARSGNSAKRFSLPVMGYPRQEPRENLGRHSDGVLTAVSGSLQNRASLSAVTDGCPPTY